ncbi:hypothetical protein ACMYR3_17030 (plasmid) [Ampullimonas aquatilis]|uniref:hypothetical protein n=1 Tax=Ampullimonas aquatilis TaxID=1341549 RepID=UPI003C78A960
MNKKRESVLNVDLLDMKPGWMAYCQKRNVTSSSAIRSVVQRLLEADQGQGGHRKVGESSTPMKTGRVINDLSRNEPKVKKELHLSAEENRLVLAIAEREGFAVSRWIASLIRARLTHEAQFNQAELEALIESSRTLKKVAKSLASIAAHLDANAGESSELKIALFQEVNRLVKFHVEKVSELLTANVERWQAK